MPEDDGFFVVRDIVPTTWKEKIVSAIHWSIVIFGLVIWWVATHQEKVMDRETAHKWLSLALQLPESNEKREECVAKAEDHFQHEEYDDMMRYILLAGQAR